MKRGHILQDPQLSTVLAEAEGVFAEADIEASGLDILLTDSNVRTVLLQALAALDENAPPRPTHARLRKKEAFLNGIEARLAARFQEMQTSGGEGESSEPEVTLATWRDILGAMLDHIETESPRVPRARNYLDQIRKAAPRAAKS